MRAILLLFLLVSLALNAGAATFYIDFVGGNDANNGTNTSSAWKLCPGMAGISMTYSHNAGDRFVFKGGVTWPASCFTMVIQNSGTAGNIDTYTSDETWYTGGAFTKPVFDFEDTLVSGTGLFSDVHSGVYVDSDYVTILGIEMKRLLIQNVADPGFNGYGVASVHLSGNSDNATVQQCVIRHWKPQATNDSDFGGIFCADGSTYTRILQNTVGWGRAANSFQTNSSGTCLSGGWWVISNHFAAAFQFMNGGAFDVQWNEFGPATNTPEPSAHCNGVFSQCGNGSIQVYANNVFHDLDVNFQTMLLHPVSLTDNVVTNSTTIIYNNLIYRCLGSHGIVLDDRQLFTSANTVRVMIRNNTIQGFGFGAVGGDQNASDYLWADIRNNHWIFDGAIDPVEPAFAQTQIMSSNVWHSIAAAAALGYTEANRYQPTSSSAPTCFAGASLTATNEPGTDGVLHPMKIDLLNVARPASGLWDAGAYQFSSGAAAAGPAITLSGRQTWSGRVTFGTQ